jgi:hypothetical protein
MLLGKETIRFQTKEDPTAPEPEKRTLDDARKEEPGG